MADLRFLFGWCGNCQVKMLNNNIEILKVLFKEFLESRGCDGHLGVPHHCVSYLLIYNEPNSCQKCP